MLTNLHTDHQKMALHILNDIRIYIFQVFCHPRTFPEFHRDYQRMLLILDMFKDR